MRLILHINRAGDRKGIGNKASSLYKMQKLGFNIPETYVLPKHARSAFIKNPDRVRDQIIKDIQNIPAKVSSWAIRSSGDLEDQKQHSFAGQFTTLLDIQGNGALLEAIENVWSSGDNIHGGHYSKLAGAAKKTGGMSVIIQEMVQTTWSGVAFSINPVTGRNECVIEAVQGSGAKLVQDGVRPFRWIWHQQGWDNEAEPEGQMKAVLEQLVEGIKRLSKAFKGAVDVEWAYNGEALFYLQCRPITASRFPTIYSNHISREVLPGMIKPLVWSINIPLVNSAWIRLLEGLLGKLNLKPEQLSQSFYYRAYFNMGTIGALFRQMGLPNDSLESLMGRKNPSGKSTFKPGLKTLRYIPSMISFLFSMFHLERRFKRAFSRTTSSTNLLNEKLEFAGPADYHRLYKELHNVASEAAYYNILIPLAFQISNLLLQKKLKQRGIPFENLDFGKDFPELSSFDPNEFLLVLQEKWAALPAEIRHEYKNLNKLWASGEDPRIKDIGDGLKNLVKQFGHFSESGNDFSSTPWREDPEFLFGLLQQQSETRYDSGVHAEKLTSRSKGIPRKAFLRAGRFRLYREMISSEYTRVYGLFRTLFLITGKYLNDKGWLEEPADVFYLDLEQHNQLMEGVIPDSPEALKKKVEAVKKEMDEYKDVNLPSLIYGETPPPLPKEDLALLKGIPTSPGIFEGELVVVKGYEDFNKKVDGKILVIPFSDVGWTPLLIRAGAIVSESGGILSHASILARELSIPAISSVDHACNLRDSQLAKVDGFSGTLILAKKRNGNGS